MPASAKLVSLVEEYKAATIEFPALKSVTLASWILESGWGSSELAVRHNNFAGMKWREEMAPFGSKIEYQAHDGLGYYCAFPSLANFIKGYWAFLERTPYAGWRDHTTTGQGFIGFVGPIWAGDPRYVEKVLDLTAEADALLSASGSQRPDGDSCESGGSGHDEQSPKPRVDRWESTSHFSSRNGTDIDHIVIHYTTSRNLEGTISHFKHGDPRTSAHYIIGRDGALVQMVNDSDRAWHAGTTAMNARSIGIEHVAKRGDKITPEQAKTSARLIAWLMREYDVARDNVIPHVCVPRSTDCCGDLFQDFGGAAGASCAVQKRALHDWMTAMGI